MALLWAESFDKTTTVADIFEATGTGGGGTIGAFGRNSTNGLKITGGNQYSRKNLGGNYATVVSQFAYLPTTVVSGMVICQFWDNGTVQAKLTIATDGTVTATGTATTFIMSVGVFHSLEVKCTIHNTTGAWIVKLDGVTVLNVSGINTRGSANNYATQFSFGEQGSGTTISQSYDDWVCMDTSGATLNDFLGDVRVERLLPSGAGGSTTWTPSVGSNFQCVDEASQNADTDYVSSSTVGQKDLYAIGDLSSVTGTIKGVVVTLRSRKDDAGTRTIKAKIKSGATEGDGADRGMSTTYAYTQDVFATNPATAAAWTPAEVNSAEAGVEVVA